MDRFAPQVAVLTNITPDHLDRYPDFEAYARAKERIFARQRPEDFSVVNADDPLAAASPTPARRVLFSRTGRVEGGAWVEEGMIRVGGRRRAGATCSRSDELALPGAHNLENALAVVGRGRLPAARPHDAIREGLTRFPGLPHRSELVAEARGVRWVNDSKGTNVDATRKCLEGFPERSVLLILGGRDKHGDFPSLVPAVARAARVVLTIGEAAETIETRARRRRADRARGDDGERGPARRRARPTRATRSSSRRPARPSTPTRTTRSGGVTSRPWRGRSRRKTPRRRVRRRPIMARKLASDKVLFVALVAFSPSSAA